MQSLPSEKKRNQRKSPLTPKKSFRKEESPPAIAMRVGGRVKKAKIPFDPSDAVTKRRHTDSNLPIKRLAGRDGPVVQNNCCQCKKNDKTEMFVNCKGDCTTRIHLNCLQSICERFGKNEELSWECYNCQSCTICSKVVTNGKPLLKCYICYAYYHPKCGSTEAEIKVIKENRFCCGYCDKSRKIINTPPNAARETVPKKTRAFAQTRAKPASTDSKFSSDGKSGFLGFNANEVVESTTSSDDEAGGPTRSQSRLARPMRNQLQHGSSTDNRSSIDDDACVIDAKEWSADQVFQYFKSIFPRHAHVFRDHEIDGPSLYLLKRGDVVRGFDIKIGPALKLYSHILMLQTKCKDKTITWQ